MQITLRGLAKVFAILMMALTGILLVTDLVITHSAKMAIVYLPEFALFFAIWYWAGGRMSTQKTRAKLISEAQTFFDQVNAAGSFPECRGTRVISRPESPVLAACGAHLYEVATERVQDYGRTSTYRDELPSLIGTRSETKTKVESVSTTRNVVRDGAHGELAATPHKLIFSGDMRTLEIELRDIIGVDIAPDGIRITLEGGRNPVSFSLANSTLWGMLVRNLIQIPIEGRALPQGAKLQIA